MARYNQYGNIEIELNGFSRWVHTIDVACARPRGRRYFYQTSLKLPPKNSGVLRFSPSISDFEMLEIRQYNRRGERYGNVFYVAIEMFVESEPIVTQSTLAKLSFSLQQIAETDRQVQLKRKNGESLSDYLARCSSMMSCDEQMGAVFNSIRALPTIY